MLGALGTLGTKTRSAADVNFDVRCRTALFVRTAATCSRGLTRRRRPRTGQTGGPGGAPRRQPSLSPSMPRPRLGSMEVRETSTLEKYRDPDSGMRRINQYAIHEELGRGAHGKVKKCTDLGDPASPYYVSTECGRVRCARTRGRRR